MKSSSGPCPAVSTISTTAALAGQHDLWFEREEERADEGYLTDLLTERSASNYIDRMADGTKADALLSEPALHRTALSLAGARRQATGVTPRVKDNLFHLDGGNIHDLPPHDPPHGRRHRPGDGGAA
jgi:hypothetical protein